MTTFLKLSSIIINTKYIQKIIIGRMFYFTSIGNEIKICANKDPIDYKILQNWIKETD